MRTIITLLLSFAYLASFAQQTASATAEDTILVIPKDPSKGFYNDYILFIPKRTPLNKKTYLLVEPNNTGKLTDTMEVHKRYAIDLASVSSVGNNVSTNLKIPLLVPVFPRPASQPFVYTHALDRDVIMHGSEELRRLDMQLLGMISDAKSILASMHILVEEKVFMNGFSASGSFTNRFSFIHPEKIKALAIGGFNGELMLPQNEIKGNRLNYPLGTNDFTSIFKKTFDLATYRSIPQYIYMGKLDDNDAVQFDDAYNEEERKIINENIGKDVQGRYIKCQDLYRAAKVNATCRSIENVGHWTTSKMNLEVTEFFLKQMQDK